ncbi:MAG: DNA photolyase [Desulfobacterales bacterium]|nr:MAG: DNA photolyase [Desulfobacterales bacterium]
MPISKLYIDQHVIQLPQVEVIRSRLEVPYIIVQGRQDVLKSLESEIDPIEKAKKVLFLTQNKGAFVKPCPGTSKYLCCGYQILNIGTYCTMECTYCILQAYLHPPLLQFFVNYDDLLNELDSLFSRNRITRIGTGEFTDSVIWEAWTDMSRRLVSKFSKQSRAVLELKTKTVDIDGFKHLHHNRKTIIAWSLNTDRIIQNEEQRTASLSERLHAAKQCESWGYPLGFHFDPLIIYDGCEIDYKQTIKELFSLISPNNIAWISLGALRFMPPLKPIVEKRFPKSKIMYGEFVLGLDGKMRYFKPIRIALYRKMVSWIKEYAPHVCLYFCMEDDDVWKKSMGLIPSDHGGLPKMLDERAIRVCGVNPKSELK